MGAVTILKRVSGRAHPQIVAGADQAEVGGLFLPTGSTAASLYTDNNTTGITIGGSATSNPTVAVNTTGTGTIDIGSATGGALSLESGGASELKVTSNNLTISTVTSGTLTVSSAAAMDIDAATALQINSSGGVISIGNDAAAQAINIGTGAADRTITIGNTTAGTDVVVTTGTGGKLTVNGDARIVGDLTVTGETHTVEGETILIEDNHLYLNNGYTTSAAPQTGGLVINYNPTATADTVAATGFTAGVAATSNPTVNTTGAAVFSASDFIQISGAAAAGNNGLFEVLSHAANLLTIRGVGVTACAEDFTQNQFTTDTTVQGAITKVNVSVIRSGTDGDWEVGKGAATGISFTNLATGGSVTLQGAYEGGNTISMTDAEGDFTISVGSGTPAILLDAAETSNFTVTGSGKNLTLSAAGGGAQQVIVQSAGTGTNAVRIYASDAAGGIDVDSGTNGITIDTTGVLSVAAVGSSDITNSTGTLLIATTTSGDISLDSVDSVVIDGAEAAADAVRVYASNAAGGIDIDAGSAGINIAAASGNVTLATSTTGDVILDSVKSVTIDGAEAAADAVRLYASDSAGGIDIDSGTAGITIDTTGVLSVASVGASDITNSTGTLTVQTTTSGDISLDSVDSVVIDGAEAAVDAVSITASDVAGGIDINAGATSGTVTIDGGGACTITTAGVNLAAGSSEIDLTTTGAVDINSGAFTVDGSTVSIDGTGATNLTTTNTTAETSVTLEITANNTGATSGDATVDINATSTNGSGVIDIDADNTITIDTAATGTISVGADAVTGTLNFGTGAAAKTVTVGSTDTTSTTTVQSGTGGISITCTATGDISLTAASNAGSDIIFTAHGSATNFNDGTNTALSGFTATSVIGALNELKADVGNGAVLSDYDTSGCTAVGSPAYISGNNTVLDGDADVESTSNIIGLVAVKNASGKVCTRGTATAIFAAGGVPAFGMPVFLSTSTGYCTVVAPTDSGDTVIEIGYLKDTTTSGTFHNPIEAGDVQSVEVMIGPRVLL